MKSHAYTMFCSMIYPLGEMIYLESKVEEFTLVCDPSPILWNCLLHWFYSFFGHKVGSLKWTYVWEAQIWANNLCHLSKLKTNTLRTSYNVEQSCQILSVFPTIFLPLFVSKMKTNLEPLLVLTKFLNQVRMASTRFLFPPSPKHNMKHNGATCTLSSCIFFY